MYVKKKEPRFRGRVVFHEQDAVRTAYLLNQGLQLVRVLENVPQETATEHELRVYLRTVAPQGTRVQRNEELGFVYDFIEY